MRTWVRFLTYLVLVGCMSAVFGLWYANVTAEEPQAIRVGIYQNKPKIYRDDLGNIRGFWADIVNDVAKKEGWNVEYVFGTWDEGLQRLERGDIDMMVDVAISKEREQKFDFNKQTVLTAWGILYVRKGVDINSFLDLKDKKVAIMKSGILYSGSGGLVDILSSFGIQAEIIDVQEYGDVFELLDHDQADVGAVNWFYGVHHSDCRDHGNCWMALPANYFTVGAVAT